MYRLAGSSGAGSSGARRVISKLVTFADAVLTLSGFFCVPLDENIANTYFLALYIVLGN